MILKYRHRKIFARIGAFAGVMLLLCSFVLFVTVSAYASDDEEQETAIAQMVGGTANRASGMDLLLNGAKDARGNFPKNEKVKDLPLVREEPEALKTTQTYTVFCLRKYYCPSELGEFSHSGYNGQHIISNIKNDFYCRI